MARTLIENTDLYRRACVLADRVYALVRTWDKLGRETVGTQLIRSIDSIGSNLVEGDGRSTDPDARKFFGYARASGREAWLNRAGERSLLDPSEVNLTVAEVTEIVKMINGLMKYRSQKFVKEARSDYGANDDPSLDVFRNTDSR